MLNKNYLVSIIIPIYNAEKTLKKCIDSILNQSYKELEIVLVDDGSVDSSLKLCYEFGKNDKRVVVLHQENQGVSAARNLGLKTATGDFIGFVDPDDWIEEKMIESMVEAIEKSKADVCVVGFKKVYGDLRTCILETKLRYELVNEKSLIIKGCISQWGAAVWNKLFSKEVLEGVVFPELQIGEDLIFCIDVFLKTRSVVTLPDVFYHYIIGENSVTAGRFDKRKSLDGIKSRRYVLDKVALMSEDLKRVAFNECAKAYYFAVLSYSHIYSRNRNEREGYYEIIEEWKKFKCSDKEKQYIDIEISHSIENTIRFMVIYKIKNCVKTICKSIIKKIYKKNAAL